MGTLIALPPYTALLPFRPPCKQLSAPLCAVVTSSFLLPPLMHAAPILHHGFGLLPLLSFLPSFSFLRVSSPSSSSYRKSAPSPSVLAPLPQDCLYLRTPPFLPPFSRSLLLLIDFFILLPQIDSLFLLAVSVISHYLRKAAEEEHSSGYISCISFLIAFSKYLVKQYEVFNMHKLFS